MNVFQQHFYDYATNMLRKGVIFTTLKLNSYGSFHLSISTEWLWLDDVVNVRHVRNT